MKCRICNNSKGNKHHKLQEAMFGTGEVFDYLECVECGTLQLAEKLDMANYYPADYFPFDLPYFRPRKGWLRETAIKSAAQYYIDGRNLAGRVVDHLKPGLGEHFPHFLRRPALNLSLRSKVLDVGCGSGGLLFTLANFGFRYLRGVDPFIASDIEKDGVIIYKAEVGQLDENFDLIIFNHSLEHMVDPVSALRNAHRMLEAGRSCVVRVPVISLAWEFYGSNWAQLDAPRHLFLFTRTSFEMTAEKAGFKVDRVVYDSTSFQFWASEQILCGIPMQKGIRGGDKYLRETFGGKMDEWEQKARELNSEGLGDQACFYLRRHE